MYFKLGGKDLLCPDNIGYWSKAGTASDGTSPFYKRNPVDYDHITIPWTPNLACDGYIHYTAKGLGEFVPSVGMRYRVFKFDFLVTNNGGPTETNRGGLNKDRPIFTLSGSQTAAQRTNTKVSADRSASSEWDQIKGGRKVFDLVKEFWEALVRVQPPAPPALPGAPTVWNPSDNHWLLDQTYFGPPSSRPVCVVPAEPIKSLENRLETALGDLNKFDGLRLFVLASRYPGLVMVAKTLRVAERLTKSGSGYRQMRVTPLLNTPVQENEVRIHFA